MLLKKWPMISTLLFAALASCGRNADDAETRGIPKARVITGFADWCAAWRLTCPTGMPPNVPSATAPWSIEQWHSAFTAVKAVAHDDVDVAFTRAELDDPNLKKALDVLGIGSLLARFELRTGSDG